MPTLSKEGFHSEGPRFVRHESRTTRRPISLSRSSFDRQPRRTNTIVGRRLAPSGAFVELLELVMCRRREYLAAHLAAGT